MSEKSQTWFGRLERRLRKSFGRGDLDTTSGRLAANINYLLFDHAILRTFWTNFYEVSPGVYRSNQPGFRRFKAYRDMGVRAVLNLRGEENYPHFHLAKEACEMLGMQFHVAKLWARNAPKRVRILAVINELREMPRPLLFHCKSGADRAGFVAAMYMMVFDDKPVQEARKMLSLRFVHLKWTKTGIQDYILDTYEARTEIGPIGFEDWIATEYIGFQLQHGWDNKRSPHDTAQALIALKGAA